MTASQLAAGRARQTAGSDQHEGVDVDAVTPGNRSSKRSEVCVWDLLDLSTADNLALHIGNLLCECEEHYYQRMLQAGDVAASPVEPVYWPQCAAWRALALVRAEPLAVPDPSSAFVLDDARWHVRLAPAGALLGNENYLVLLLENLLRNAQFFSRKRGYRSPFASIAVILTEQDGHACLRVYNRGPHIPEADRPNLFQLGFSTRRSREHQGRGVGCAGSSISTSPTVPAVGARSE